MLILFAIFKYSSYNTSETTDIELIQPVYEYETVLEESAIDIIPENKSNKTNTSNITNYKCDGRKYCSEMTSCEEATFFINNCPNTKMDGNGDGVPCERQWCN